MHPKRHHATVSSSKLAMALLCGAAAALTTGASAVAATAASTETSTAETTATTTSVTQLGEVLVTARRETENLQKVPLSVVAIGKDALVEQAIVNPIDIQLAAPSIQSYIGYSHLVGSYDIRGIPGVGVYFAEAPTAPPLGGVPLYDMDSAQVLNGPQGTLFGRSSVAGDVLLTPSRPNLEATGGFVDLNAGSLGFNHDTAVVNLPIVPGHLAIRLGAQIERMDGYTNVIGSSLNLSGTNNYSGRISVDWKPGDGRFDLYSVLDYAGASETSSGWVLAAYNPNISTFHQPASINAPGGLAAGTAAYGAVCNAAVAAGIQSNVNDCINQRLMVAATFLPELQAETARISAGGNAALRQTAGPIYPGTPTNEYLNQFLFVNQASYDFGKIGFTTMTLKNIFGMRAVNGASGWEIDGVGGSVFSAISGNTGPFFFSNSANQHANLNAPATGFLAPSPYSMVYTEELKANGVVGDDFLTWTIGGFYSNQPVPVNLNAIQNIARTFGGVGNEPFGFNPSFQFQNGGSIWQKAAYAQGVFNLSRLAPFLKGLHFTAGGRFSSDSTTEYFTRETVNPVSGAFVTSPTAYPTAHTTSSGTNTTFALDAQVTDHLLVYGTTRTAYVPGGVNTVTAAAQTFANFQPTYSPEAVTDYEAGVKYDFAIGDAAVRLDADAFDTKFSNIFVTEFASVGTVTATFTLNAASAEMKGVEFSGQMVEGPFHLTINDAFTDARYTKWIGSDPLNLITPANAGPGVCLANSPVGICNLDLSNSHFPNVPRNKITGSLVYTVPTRDEVGKISLIVSGMYQSQTWFAAAASRNIQAFAPIVGYAVVARAEGQEGYGIVNLRAEWKNIYGSRVTAAAFINNLGNYNYALGSISVLQSLGVAVDVYGEPRVAGLQLRYEFGG
jgi:iron complex outermembrane receptor protein